MADEHPHYLGIGKVQINEAFLNQVASSRQRLAGEPADASPNGPSGPEPMSEEITPRMREEARAFIKEYFLIEDRDDQAPAVP
jgi:hypothetical protein